MPGSGSIFQEEGWRGWLYFRENICTHVGHAWNFLAQPRSEEDPGTVFLSSNAQGRENGPKAHSAGQGCGEEKVSHSISV